MHGRSVGWGFYFFYFFFFFFFFLFFFFLFSLILWVVFLSCFVVVLFFTSLRTLSFLFSALGSACRLSRFVISVHSSSSWSSSSSSSSSSASHSRFCVDTSFSMHEAACFYCGRSTQGYTIIFFWFFSSILFLSYAYIYTYIYRVSSSFLFSLPLSLSSG
ncbi:hypothetical protein VTK26DRAFT_8183 [Humicola hyalothermophila]